MCGLLFFGRCTRFVVCWSLYAVCCLLVAVVAYCVLFVVCRLCVVVCFLLVD